MLIFAKQLAEGHYDCLLNRPDGSTVEWAQVIESNRDTHIVFFNRSFIVDFMQRIKRMFIDGTFQTRAQLQDCIQLLTVLVVYMAKVL